MWTQLYILKGQMELAVQRPSISVTYMTYFKNIFTTYKAHFKTAKIWENTFPKIITEFCCQFQMCIAYKFYFV
jgi:hypothetical protein